MESIFEVIRSRCGIDLGGYNPHLVQRRLAARMEQVGVGDLLPYLELLRIDPEEAVRLVDAVGVNVTAFFRDPIVFERLTRQVLPEVLRRKEREGSREVRIWSAGCSTGEEACSLAIVLHRSLKRRPGDWLGLVIATDTDREALARAKTAVYPKEQLENVTLGALERYFVPRGDCFEVVPEIREMVCFSWDDLTSSKLTSPAESVFGSFDVIVCCNVLIYFSTALQGRVLDKLCRALSPQGYLVLGDAEVPGPALGTTLEVVEHPRQVFRKRQ